MPRHLLPIFRVLGILGFVGLLGAAALVIMMIVGILRLGLNRDNWYGPAIALVGVLLFVARRRRIMRFVHYGLTGNERDLQ